MANPETAADTSKSSNVTDHAYKAPDGQSWARCVAAVSYGDDESERPCGLSEAAHAATTARYETGPLPYRCPWCVDTGAEVCPHGPKGALDMTGAIL